MDMLKALMIIGSMVLLRAEIMEALKALIKEK